jgi:hypothetical protein
MKRLAALLVMVALAIPIASVSAAQTFTFECTDPSGPPVTACWVAIDADIHNGNEGFVIFRSDRAGKHTIELPAMAGNHRISVFAASRTAEGVNTSVMVQQTAPSGCKAGWAPIGYQSWWSDPDEDPVFGSRHVHIDNMCQPVNNLIVSGVQTFAFQVQLHEQPEGARITRIRLKDYPGGTDRWVAPKPYPVPDANGNLIAPFSMTLDTDRLSAGRHEMRWGVYVTQPDGKVQLLSTRSEVCIRSCSPAYRSGTWQGNGSWYTGNAEYVDTRIFDPWPASADPPSGTPATTPSPVVTPTLTPPPSVCA